MPRLSLLLGYKIWIVKDVIVDAYCKDLFVEVLEFDHVLFVLCQVLLFGFDHALSSLLSFSHVFLVDEIAAVQNKRWHAAQVHELLYPSERKETSLFDFCLESLRKALLRLRFLH